MSLTPMRHVMSYLLRHCSAAYLCTMLVTAAVGAQSPLFFTVNGTESAASSIGGSIIAPGNFAAVFRDESVVMVTPAAGSNAHACADRATWAAHFGDDDADGDFIEGVVGKIDGLHLAAGAANPPSIFDFWITVSDDVLGPLGSLAGATVRDGDIFRILPGGGVRKFITETQFGTAMNTLAAINVDAFALNETNGDIYFSLSTTLVVAGATLEDGGVLRIPGSAYTLAADGTVAAITSGSAQIVLHEVHVNIFFAVAGQGAVGDLKDICLAPGGGTFTGNAGLSVPNLWFTGDMATSGAVVVSSTSGGSIAVLNGITLLGGAAFGLRPTDWTGLANGTLNGLALGTTPLQGSARFLSIADTALFTPGTLKIDAAGCTPGPTLFLFANFGVAGIPGSFTPRTIIAQGNPVFASGGFRELYVDDFMDPLFQLMATLPALNVSSSGYASLSLPLPAVPPGVAFAIQGIDASNLSLTTPLIVVTQ